MEDALELLQSGACLQLEHHQVDSAVLTPMSCHAVGEHSACSVGTALALSAWSSGLVLFFLCTLQVNCGVELGALLVETLSKAAVPFTKEQLGQPGARKHPSQSSTARTLAHHLCLHAK